MNLIRLLSIILGLFSISGNAIGTDDVYPLRLTNKPDGTISPDKVYNDCQQNPPQPSSEKRPFHEDGHLYTTFIIAKLGGLEDERAYTLSYYSQYPDIDKNFNAGYVSIQFWKKNFWKKKWKKDIKAILHSLHGKEGKEVDNRRKILGGIIKDQLNKDQRKNSENIDWQTGMIIHSLGDAYSHTEGEYDSGREEAYGHAFGHLKDGVTPDIIARPEVKKRYIGYINKLYQSLPIKPHEAEESKKAFDNYLDVVDKIKDNNSWFASHKSKTIIDYARSKDLMLKEALFKCMNDRARKLTEKEVQKVIDTIKVKIYKYKAKL